MSKNNIPDRELFPVDFEKSKALLFESEEQFAVFFKDLGKALIPLCRPMVEAYAWAGSPYGADSEEGFHRWLGEQVEQQQDLPTVSFVHDLLVDSMQRDNAQIAQDEERLKTIGFKIGEV